MSAFVNRGINATGAAKRAKPIMLDIILKNQIFVLLVLVATSISSLDIFYSRSFLDYIDRHSRINFTCSLV